MVIGEAAKCDEDKCSSMNVHWRPYYAACSYCDLQYNFISKVDITWPVFVFLFYPIPS